MGDTSISWTDKTWNPGQGCSRVSEGCRHCYAERLAARFAESGWSQGLIKWNGVVRLAAHKLADPLRWRKPCRVFVNSMTDLFHDGYSNEQIAAVFGVMAAAPQHTFQVLTKRAKRMREWFEWAGRQLSAPQTCIGIAESSIVDGSGKITAALVGHFDRATWPLPNVWNGVSVESQAAADERIPELEQTPAAVRFLSCEPLLGHVDINRWLDIPHEGPHIDWVIAGCESGPGARPCDVAWLRSLRDQCATAGVPFFLKQAVDAGGDVINGVDSQGRAFGVTCGTGSKMKPGRVIELPYLDGVQHAAFPEVSP